jgi:hypothetical protein
MSNIQEKSFEWSWRQKNQKGPVFAQYNPDKELLKLWVKAGWATATGKGRLPADITTIFEEIVDAFTGTFDGQQVPVATYFWNMKDVLSSQYGVKSSGATARDSYGTTDLKVYADLGTRKNVFLGDLQIYNFERIHTGTDPRQYAGNSVLAWAILYEYAMQQRFNSNEIAYKLPLGEVTITETNVRPPKWMRD